VHGCWNLGGRPGRWPLDTEPALARLHLAAERRHAVTTPQYRR